MGRHLDDPAARVLSLIAAEHACAPGQCWIWRGHLDRDGNGKLSTNGTTTSAARAVWAVVRGAPPPADKRLLRNCGARGCVHPDHHAPTAHDEVVREIFRQGRPFEFADTNGEMNPFAKLRDEDVLFIRAQTRAYGLRIVLARLFLVSPDTIDRVRARACWTHLGKGNSQNAMTLDQLRALADQREIDRAGLSSEERDHAAQSRSAA